jgi:hypothetical protein
MKKAFLFVLLIVLVVALGACATPAPTTTELKDPTITLNTVQVQGYFAPPWAGWPGAVPTPTPNPSVITPTQYIAFPGTISVPLVVAFVWDVNNPNDVPVTLEQMKFTVEFEAAPSKAGEYFALATPMVYEKQSIPGKMTNQIRAVVVLDSAVVPGNLAVTNGQRLGALKLSGATLVKDWWTNIPDSKFGIKATSGTADVTMGTTKKVVTFEGKFPK